ncbi:hypothetical protein GLOTRDRAFT_89773 [Gloeophyllum trabeum ATCC 11539]|uniref:Cupin type-2 domain-containing protein n=1 Tax=Gloeophyllum trabeum (strain ATCC 11539 / FP-39264 / Madison 617) TaxID=670483 RepID=S7QLF2_GLOTA|nr:uncharacterized protein GLOTRDRAFT_89773 [Gloeophyllum trabeum ATCC 11539]EPQ60188.1 hypothetical protein GLOTRDRAFT_89773 [Gloeophyllum trabeum ATCC 11539]
MLKFFQDRLFPKVPLIPMKMDDEGYYVQFGGARRHKTIKMSDDEYIFRCEYDPKDPFTGAGRETGAFPLLHWHRNQDEWFKVIQGRVGYVLDGKSGFVEKGTEVALPSGVIHTFWVDPNSPEKVIMEFTVRPGRGLDEEWIDSFYGVLNSCYEAKKPLSFLQAMVFCDEAISAPGHFPKPIGIFMAWFFGVADDLVPGRIIGRLAGYRGTYPQYVNQRKDKKFVDPKGRTEVL